ncbi:MAG: substrate-binding domain-containing protein [Terrimonas sp.]|nr:substrate-binding domain-containing protein [Terrimonas sp.]
MQQSTLKELSEVLGISISTVSRALKDHPDISEATKKKVKELAIALEYEPNSYAVNLRTKQTNVLGILVPSIDNFFYDSFIAAVEEEARLHNYSVLIMQSRDELEIETACLHLFRKKMVSGLFVSISIEIQDMAPFQKLKDNGVPVLFFDRVPETREYHKVCLSDEKAATLAADAIIARGKKKVLGLFGHPQLSITKARCAAFNKRMQHNAPDTVVEIYYPEQIETSRKLVLSLFEAGKKYDVIFAMGDMILMGVMQAIHELDLAVPGEVAVISISNGLIPTLFKPRVTYVETSGGKLGKLAFSQMLSCLQHQTIAEVVFLDSMLVEGGSL